MIASKLVATTAVLLIYIVFDKSAVSMCSKEYNHMHDQEIIIMKTLIFNIWWYWWGLAYYFEYIKSYIGVSYFDIQHSAFIKWHEIIWRKNIFHPLTADVIKYIFFTVNVKQFSLSIIPDTKRSQ